jgi:hypothetical protein
MSSSRRIAHRAIGGAAVAGAAALATVLVSACGSPKPAAATSPASKTSSPGASASSAATSSAPAGAGSATSPAGSSGGGSGTGGAPPCSSRYLRADKGLAQGTAGSVYTVIKFTNLNNASCTLYGYPGVSFGAGKPVTQVGLAATENPTTPRELVTLKPGGVASALLQIVDAGNYSASQCQRVTATWLQIYPPNQTVPLYLPYTSMTCAKHVRILTVSAVRPGSGG